MMQHFKDALARPRDMTLAAQISNPDNLADLAVEYNSGTCAIASIISRGHWTLVNGHWCKNQPDGVYL